jgi:hypothetical protein
VQCTCRDIDPEIIYQRYKQALADNCKKIESETFSESWSWKVLKSLKKGKKMVNGERNEEGC